MRCDNCGVTFRMVKRSKESETKEKEIYADRKEGMGFGELARKYDRTTRTIIRAVARMRHREISLNKKEGTK